MRAATAARAILSDMSVQRRIGWHVLAVVAAVLGALGVVAGLAQLLDGDLSGLIGIVWAGVFWYWIAAGAWRCA